MMAPSAPAVLITGGNGQYNDVCDVPGWLGACMRVGGRRRIDDSMEGPMKGLSGGVPSIDRRINPVAESNDVLISAHAITPKGYLAQHLIHRLLTLAKAEGGGGGLQVCARVSDRPNGRGAGTGGSRAG